MKKLLQNLLMFQTLFTSTLNAPKMVAVPIILIFANSAEGLRLQVYNRSNSISHSSMEIQHIEGATEGQDWSYDGIYLESSNLLHIYSHNSLTGFDYKVDARSPDSTTTYDLHLKNIGGFSGTVDNFLSFVMKDDSNFKLKNIFLGDANDSDNIVADIKHVIDNGSTTPVGGYPYGDFPLPDIEGSNTGVYDKRKVFFFNYTDLNRDRKVNGLDFAILAQNWARDERAEPNDPNNTLGTYVGKEPNDLDAYSDINRDGVVDFKDFAIFAGKWFYDADDPKTW